MQKFTITNEEGDEEEIELPTHKEVCPTCQGEGKHSGHLGAFTRDEMDEQGPEFFEDYMRGFYDKTCEQCGGLRVVDVIDLERVDPETRAKYEKWADEEARYRQICEMERRMGA
jgi:hypothetical protein